MELLIAVGHLVPLEPRLEVVFNTGMTGYQEVLTDPSYCGQIVVFTYPELGNTDQEDEESDRPQVRVRSPILPSLATGDQLPADYLKQHNIPGIHGIDTRALTRKIRVVGAINGGISTETRRLAGSRF